MASFNEKDIVVFKIEGGKIIDIDYDLKLNEATWWEFNSN